MEDGVERLPHSKSPALEFEVLATWKRARCSRLTVPHSVSYTPMFMPVGTQGTIKGLSTRELDEIQTQIVLGNTYHLENRPGSELLKEKGGIHNFMNYSRGMLTDSGGFQMVSLLDLADITEEGVTFQAPTTGERMLLTPEKSMEVQNNIGADIMMALDDVVSSVVVDAARFEEATHRTIRWIDRCIAAHKRPNEQSLFGIVQGGLDRRLRDICLKGLVARGDQLPGYAIGGLAGGEDKHSFWKVVEQCTAGLPESKPRYVMGVGYPLDIVVCSCLGADMYDCVYPTRTARFGTALVPEGVLKLKAACYANDYRPIDPTCTCAVCKRYSRAYLHSIVTRQPRASSLVSYHNLSYMMRFTREMREAIMDGSLEGWVQGFVQTQKAQFPNQEIPLWVKSAMEVAGIAL